MKTLILLRHGQSVWNLENRFTGWTDVELSEKGRAEAKEAGRKIREAGLLPRFYVTSFLKRAIHTLQIAADEMDRAWIPVIKDWHLNERHYGALQGLNKADTAKEYGEEQVLRWRRSYNETPPPLARDDVRFPGKDVKYADLADDELPLTESLETTIHRVFPCWEEIIAPKLRLYDNVLVTAHGNSLRALAMMLMKLTPEEVMKVEIPTGSPWIFELDDKLNLIRNYYL